MPSINQHPRHLCLTCGYDGKPKGCPVCKRVKKKKHKPMQTDREAAAIKGAKDREHFLRWVASGLDGFGMDTTGSDEIDTLASQYRKE